MNDSWLGYARADGSKGVRNKVLVIYTVECSAFVAREIGRRCAANAASDVDVVGFAGCTDNEYAVRLLLALIRHPNIGGALAVGLGCEYVQAEWLKNAAVEAGKYGEFLFVQNEGGTLPTIEKGCALVEQMRSQLAKTERLPMTIGDLVIGAECGGSDYTSGLAGNACVGRFFDRLVDAGGTAIFEEIVEAVGLVDILASRAAHEKARHEITVTYNKALAYCKSVRQYSVSPGNFAGGLSSIEEKSMGAIVKSGSRPIQGVIKVGARPPLAGLWLLDTTPDPYWMQFGITNPNDNEGLTSLVSSGAHIVLLITGRGNVVGSAVSPCIKVTGNAETYARMSGDMDFNAGPALDNSATLEELARSLETLIIETAAGRLSNAERLGHREYCIPYKYQTPACTDA